MGGRRRFPTMDVSPSDSDVHIVPAPEPPARSHEGDAPSMVAFPLTRPRAEQKFWTDEGNAAADDEEGAPVVDALPRRRTGRSILAKLLFTTIVLAVLTLVACEVSIAYRVPWLDPRPMLAKVVRSIVERVARLYHR